MNTWQPEEERDWTVYVPQQQALLLEARVRGVSLRWRENEGIVAAETMAHQNLTVSPQFCNGGFPNLHYGTPRDH